MLSLENKERILVMMSMGREVRTERPIAHSRIAQDRGRRDQEDISSPGIHRNLREGPGLAIGCEMEKEAILFGC